MIKTNIKYNKISKKIKTTNVGLGLGLIYVYVYMCILVKC
jgi:hypothetical protein